MNKVKANNNDVGGRKFEMSDMSYIIRGLGYIKDKADIESIALASNKGIPVRVKDIGTVQMGGDLRLGIFDQNGEGEVVGGIVVMRNGENADKVIGAVKEKMKDVEKGLPEGVKFQIAYDRSSLIEAAIANIKGKLGEEMLAVSLVVHPLPVPLAERYEHHHQIPITVAISFILLNAFGCPAIHVLTGIALASVSS